MAIGFSVVVVPVEVRPAKAAVVNPLKGLVVSCGRLSESLLSSISLIGVLCGIEAVDLVASLVDGVTPVLFAFDVLLSVVLVDGVTPVLFAFGVTLSVVVSGGHAPTQGSYTILSDILSF